MATVIAPDQRLDWRSALMPAASGRVLRLTTSESPTESPFLASIEVREYGPDGLHGDKRGYCYRLEGMRNRAEISIDQRTTRVTLKSGMVTGKTTTLVTEIATADTRHFHPLLGHDANESVNDLADLARAAGQDGQDTTRLVLLTDTHLDWTSRKLRRHRGRILRIAVDASGYPVTDADATFLSSCIVRSIGPDGRVLGSQEVSPTGFRYTVFDVGIDDAAEQVHLINPHGRTPKRLMIDLRMSSMVYPEFTALEAYCDQPGVPDMQPGALLSDEHRQTLTKSTLDHIEKVAGSLLCFSEDPEFSAPISISAESLHLQPATLESPMSELPNPHVPTTTRLSEEVRAAAYQVVAGQLTTLGGQSLAAILQRDLANDSPEMRAKVGQFLESKTGQVTTALLLSALVGPLGGALADRLGVSAKQLDLLSSALRVHAMVNGGNALLDTFMEPAVAMLKETLRGLPVEPDSPPRLLPEAQPRDTFDGSRVGAKTAS